MVPVEVGDERRAPERSVDREGLAPEAQPGAQVEHDRVHAGRLDRHTRRVPSVATVLLARARSRTSDPPEADVQQVDDPRFPREFSHRTQTSRCHALTVTDSTPGVGATRRNETTRHRSAPRSSAPRFAPMVISEGERRRERAHVRLPGGWVGSPSRWCLHGFPDSAWTWRHLLPELAAAGFRAVAPFLRGYTPTAVPADGLVPAPARWPATPTAARRPREATARPC